ncbi:mannose-1-phosphate guanylyltransferase [Aeromicrobium wangtongii]|uniref:Sugar phosphate nucleotidyltransferase n=1 Tax=Aeromicrobium wangtongii TaxID=2969247 RepID=A0ABY5MB15_9ACTN|nr:mannose-1-phosphate guanylyltransferase [Aeromicrobium wangtongii]MCD9196675.1 mannose-1-phosphate guanylyltransferase [Aeromicrobium wangtongii]UUP14185.1 sugar phosphate nucleotidyltransferase [Aeromicrobium wangtongii]
MTSPENLDSFHAVIPAGGAGTRLWPLSRASRPKFLLDLDGSGRSLLQQTWDRLNDLVPAERIHVVTGAAHAAAIQEQLPELTSLFVEPSPRDSMPAIGLAAAVIGAAHPDAIIGSFAADHIIDDQVSFAEAIGQAVCVARSGLVTTVGITPTGPSTAFGYIQSGERLAVEGAESACAVTSFVEKPDAATATAYVASGAYSWNGGMFVTRTDVLLGHLARLQPGLHEGLSRIAAAWAAPERQDVLDATWPALTKIAIDHAIAEPVALEGGMAVVPGEFTWDDVGDFAALQDVGAASSPETIWVDAGGLAISEDGTTIAVVGLDDVIVVRTDDALLVVARDHAQQVKSVVAELKRRGRDDLV